MFCFKIIIVGDTSIQLFHSLGVGKSCLLLQYTDERFKNNHDPTIGIGFGSKEIQIGDQNIQLHIWDTAGQESFRSLTRSFYRGAVGGIMVYDVTSRQSFEDLVQWYEKIRGYACEEIELIIVANKADLKEQRQVSTKEGIKFAEQYKFEYYETSAKTGQQVKFVFEHLAHKIHQRVISGEIECNPDYGIKIKQIKENAKIVQKTTCC